MSQYQGQPVRFGCRIGQEASTTIGKTALVNLSLGGQDSRVNDIPRIRHVECSETFILDHGLGEQLQIRIFLERIPRQFQTLEKLIVSNHVCQWTGVINLVIGEKENLERSVVQQGSGQAMDVSDFRVAEVQRLEATIRTFKGLGNDIHPFSWNVGKRQV